jgi:hypothetical protein
MHRDKLKRYPPDWKAISTNIRVHRAKDRCERCGLQNGQLIKRAKDGSYRDATDDERRLITYLNEKTKLKLHVAIKRVGLIKIVLTVAHLDHDESNCTAENLLCVCQRCHFNIDKLDNLARRKTSIALIRKQLSLLL